jgi:predicted RNase H-like HicB family nuclease
VSEQPFRYEVIIYWSREDDAFIAEMSELPGCIAHGGSYEEALDRVQDAARLWVDTARADGAPAPQPRGRPMFA